MKRSNLSRTDTVKALARIKYDYWMNGDNSFSPTLHYEVGAAIALGIDTHDLGEEFSKFSDEIDSEFRKIIKARMRLPFVKNR
jgi:hypothetical protein